MEVEHSKPRKFSESSDLKTFLRSIRGRLKKIINKDFGENVEKILKKTRTRLGDVFYSYFWSIDNFYNLLRKIEQYDAFYDISNADDPFFTWTYRKKWKYGFEVPERDESWKVSLVKKEAKYDKIYSEWWFFIVEKDGKKWLFNMWWQQILDLKYDEIKVIDNFIFFEQSGSRKMMNRTKTLEEANDLSYTEILQNKRLKLLWYHVVIIKSEDGKIWLLSTKDGKIIFEPSYDKYRIDFLGNRIIFENTSTWESCCYEEPSNEDI